MLNRALKKIFGFVSSVRMAIPSMLTLITVIAFGTIVESRYNADYAKMVVYNNPWFNALLILIWLNILFAALSRWPWKRHHTGFLITHLGLLLLFGGGFVTNVWGIDGSLRVADGQSANQVVVSDFVLGIQSERDSQPYYYDVTRGLRARARDSFQDLNRNLRGLISIEGYEPFVEIKESRVPTSEASSAPKEPLELSFRLKSAFFDVNQQLQSEQQPETQMGPAVFRLVKVAKLEAEPKKKPNSKSLAKPSTTRKGETHLALSLAGQASKIFGLDLSALPKSFNWNGFEVTVTRFFRSAVVADGGIRDGGGNANPAVEIFIKKADKKSREVLFAKYPDFSLRQGEFADFKAKFVTDTSDAVNASGPSGESSSKPKSGNQVLIHYTESEPRKVRIDLMKNDETVASRIVAEGETFQTPWMGMQITPVQMAWGASRVLQITPIEPLEKSDRLPASALRVVRYEGAPSEETWLIEGEDKRVTLGGTEYSLYFGRKIIQLPFQVRLLKFTKTDYPGTTMAKQFESQVEVPGQSQPVTISMNEPLKMGGYTFYQSSYEQLPNGSYASIFSVNRDPGRPFKYLGGIILAIGIVTYTFMKSRRFQKAVQR